MKKLLLFLALSTALHAAPEPARFDFQSIQVPHDIDPQVGGVAVLPDGKVVTVFHRGEVMIYDPAAKTWSRFAEGLHEPLGILVESPSSFLIMQRPELTRVKDTNGDGVADEYETVFDDFGISGNYHEFAFGPVKDKDGNLYIALNLASQFAGVSPEIRGTFTDIGALDRKGMTRDKDWSKRSGKAGRMYSRVNWRGWVLKLSPDGKQMEPFASGFRSPDGIGFDPDGNLLVTDNEGDWRGTSPLYIAKAGGFYGNPASLVWTKGWDKGDPLKVPVAELQKMRTAETGRFPQGFLANSPTEPAIFPKSWGPYAGQVVLGEMNQNRMVRYLPDDVAGFRQSTLIPMFDDTELGSGNHRVAFGPDGAMWVGKTHLSWAGAEGLVKVTPKDAEKIFTVVSCHVVKAAKGQEMHIRLSQPVAATLPNIAVERYDYLYHQDYGSPQIGKAAVPVENAKVSADGLEITLPMEMKEGFIHQVDLTPLVSKEGSPLEGKLLYYQASKLP